MIKYLIIGSKGQLGKEFVELFNNLSYNFTGFDIDEMDINDYARTKEIITLFKPDIIINCSAYNDVDQSELNPEPAINTNELAVKNLAQLCESLNCFLIHYSSDYVFEGNRDYYKYKETDLTNPLNVYGRSKLRGENNIKETLEKYLIFRVSWVYGKGKQNFIYKFLSWSKKDKILKITYDEISIPTCTFFIAKYTLEALKRGMTGLYHLTNLGYASRYEWALEIAKLFKIENKIESCSINEFNLPAKRPFFSAMDNNLFFKNINEEPKHWQDYLYDYFYQNNYSHF